MYVLLYCMFVSNLHSWYWGKSEEGANFPEKGDIDGYEHTWSARNQMEVL